MRLGEVIKECREQRKYSQKELASRAKLSVSHLCLIEKGKREPSMGALESLSCAMNIPTSVLVFLGADRKDLKDFESVDIDKLSKLIKGLIEDAHA